MRSEVTTPPGMEPARIGAFFDVDNTLTRSTIVPYYTHFELHGKSRLYRSIWWVLHLPHYALYALLDWINRGMFIRFFYRQYRNVDVGEYRTWCRTHFLEFSRPRLMQAALERVRMHQEAGHTVVILSGGIEPRVLHVAEHLGIHHVKCVRLEEQDGRYTGAIAGSSLVDEEKRDALFEAAREWNLDLEQSYGYGDSTSDRFFLEHVAQAHVINPSSGFERLARRKGWTICRWE